MRADAQPRRRPRSRRRRPRPSTRRPPGRRPCPGPAPARRSARSAARSMRSASRPQMATRHSLGGQGPGRGPTQSARRAGHRRTPSVRGPGPWRSRYRVPSLPRPCPAARPAAWVGSIMELSQIGADVYACLQPDTGLGAANSGFVEPRRRTGGRHALRPAPHPASHRPVRHRVPPRPPSAWSTPTTTATTAGATSSSPSWAARSSAIGLCAEWFGQDGLTRAVRRPVRGRRRAARLRSSWWPTCAPSTSTASS